MKWYQKVVGILFFIFFTCPVFSPSIFGLTCYLYYFIPFLDFKFVQFLFDNCQRMFKKKKLVFSLCAVLLLSILLQHVVFAIELILLLVVLTYLIYAYKNGFFKYLYFFVNINIVIGIVQFLSYYLYPELLEFLNPTYIAHWIWGPFATGTWNNLFPDTTSLVRVSALSREAGFFASLIISSFLCYNFTEKKVQKSAQYYIQNAFFVIGFFISFSKVSLLILPAYFVLKYRNAINLFKISQVVLFILIGGILVSNTFKISRYYDANYSSLYETFSHRFGGYSLLGQIDIKTALLGTERISDLSPVIQESNYFMKYILKFDTVCGVPSLFIQQGFIIAILFYYFLKCCGFKAADILFLSIITITVNYTTQTSFVLLAYFICFYFILRKQNVDNKNILIVNELIWGGGAEKYAINLYKLFKEKGYNVRLLTFDNQFRNNLKFIDCSTYKDFYNLELNEKWKKIGKVLFQPLLYLKLHNFIQKFNPDHILVNNVFSCPLTFYSVINGYDNIQVVHDVGIVCPKSTCIQNNDNVCHGYKFQDCLLYCTYHNSKKILRTKLWQLKCLEFLRKRVVRLFISPSKWLKDYLCQSDYHAIQLPNPIEGTELKGTTKKNNHLLYVGAINENKGIFQFIEKFNDLHIDIKLDIIGRPQSKKDAQKLNELISANTNIHYLGEKSNEEVLKFIHDSYCLVVPSLGLENYPTTVLEGMVQKTLVVGSNRAGVAELIDNPLLEFDLDDRASIHEVLQYAYDLDDKAYSKIVENNYNVLIQRNNPESFYQTLQKLLGE